MVSVLSILGGGLRPPSEASPRESLRRQSRRSNSVHHVPRGSLLLVSVPGLLGHERRFPTVRPYSEGGLRPPSEASPRESLRRQSRRSNSVHHVPRGSLLLVSVPGLLGHERRF